MPSPTMTSNKAQMSTLTASFQHCNRDSSLCKKVRKINKRHPDLRTYSYTVLFEKYMINSVEYLLESPKILELINELNES